MAEIDDKLYVSGGLGTYCFDCVRKMWVEHEWRCMATGSVLNVCMASGQCMKSKDCPCGRTGPLIRDYNHPPESQRDPRF